VARVSMVLHFILHDKGVLASVSQEDARRIGIFLAVQLTPATDWPCHTNTYRVIAPYDA